jgi:hypothetical protein
MFSSKITTTCLGHRDHARRRDQALGQSALHRLHPPSDGGFVLHQALDRVVPGPQGDVERRGRRIAERFGVGEHRTAARIHDARLAGAAVGVAQEEVLRAGGSARPAGATLRDRDLDSDPRRFAAMRFGTVAGGHRERESKQRHEHPYRTHWVEIRSRM